MSEENKVVVRRFFEELLSTDNLAVADELLSPDFRFYFAGSPDPMNLERYKEFLVARRATFPDRRFAVEDMIAEGDKVSARFTMRGTHAPSAREVSMTGIDIIRLAEGKMVEDRVEVDQLGMMRQLGAIPQPGSAVHGGRITPEEISGGGSSESTLTGGITPEEISGGRQPDTAPHEVGVPPEDISGD